MRTHILLSSWLLAAPLLAALDGSEWSVTLHETGLLRRGSREDVLRFHEGQLTADRRVAEGYLSSAYEASTSEDRLSWRATQTNLKGERLDWTGAGDAERMGGVLRVSRRDGKVVEYRWKAARRVR